MPLVRTPGDGSAARKCGAAFVQRVTTRNSTRRNLQNEEPIASKCPNCSQQHQASSSKCPIRPVTNRLRDTPTSAAAPPPPLTSAAFRLLPSTKHLQSCHLHTPPERHPYFHHLTSSSPPHLSHTPPTHPTQPPSHQTPDLHPHTQPIHSNHPLALQTPGQPPHPPAFRPPQAGLPHPNNFKAILK